LLPVLVGLERDLLEADFLAEHLRHDLGHVVERQILGSKQRDLLDTAPPLAAMRSSIANEPVTKPPRPAQSVPRPSMETPTTRPTPCLVNASAAGRVKPAKAASTNGARRSGGVSQKTAPAPAPANALSTTAASQLALLSARIWCHWADLRVGPGGMS
jgi:hypothetical protein